MNKPAVESAVQSQHEGESLSQPTAAEKENSENSAVEVDRKSRSESKSIAAESTEALGVQQSLSTKSKPKKGKRKSKKIRDDTSTTLNAQGPEIETPLNHAGTAEVEYSNGEDVEMEDAGDDGEIDPGSRNEEGSEWPLEWKALLGQIVGLTAAQFLRRSQPWIRSARSRNVLPASGISQIPSS